MRTRLLRALGFGVVGAVCLTALLQAAPGSSAVAEAAMRGDKAAVRTLLKEGADVNAAQGDGMTALHWAAMKGDAELAQMLIYGGANVRATTRLGAYTPLHLAARNGHAPVVAVLLPAGAQSDAAASTGATALMLAASAGDARAVTMLIEGGAKVNAKEHHTGQTPLMFAAAANRVEVIRALTARGADVTLSTKVVDLSALTAPEEENSQRSQAGPGPVAASTAKPAVRPADIAGLSRPFRYNELIGTQGGLTPMQYAVRQGYTDSVTALIDAGADVNQVNPGDKTSPILVATLNGHFDLAMLLLEKGADPTIAADNGVTPLYAALNLQWAPKALYPQPRAYQQQKTSYLDLMKAYLDKGSDPNVRLKRKVWYAGYNFDLSGVDEIGATPFWRAAYGGDIEAMRMLMARGADPTIPTVKPAGRPRTGDATRQIVDVSGLPAIPVGGPGVPPLLAAAGVGYGEGFAANSHRHAPGGLMASVKYLVEEMGADVNAVDHEGSTALHHAAARGDNAMIEYLVSKGADVTKVNREGQTTADMANGPVQRVQPFAETVTLLMKLGAKNSNKCVTC